MRGAAAAVLASSPAVAGHGSLTYPPSRQLGTVAAAGSCLPYGQCLWFSQPAEIAGEPTLSAAPLRTYNAGIDGGADDWTRRMPWRAPGTAPVLGSGCGMAGGNLGKNYSDNGGFSPNGRPQGMDGVLLPPLPGPAPVWRRGSEQEVAWAVTANHGGGYSYRLCRRDGDVNEECFRRGTLRFAGATQWLQRGGDRASRVAVPRVATTNGTSPPGSEWARNPIPACNLCNVSRWMEGEDLSLPKEERIAIGPLCGGFNVTTSGGACPRNETQFPEPAPGVSGWGGGGTEAYNKSCEECGRVPVGMSVNVVDRVAVPRDIPQGSYLLSWRWDCEESKQVWQGCADVSVL